ncbi:hypothetical protein [Deminuibacter soli]|uniref:Uncharacterized protein n=1 Tax=Deminuibacter soli TaxID=2291815 RepID=A0A3E1NF93_9BACT|nr:hypothetical protein [Deminuibacter soli]RFM26481.1 hypothetical protein DXN05_19850 [Deminuibacter soli]
MKNEHTSHPHSTGKEIKQKHPSTPMTREEDVQNSPDEKTDEDYPNFPHPPADKKTIKTQTKNPD